MCASVFLKSIDGRMLAQKAVQNELNLYVYSVGAYPSKSAWPIAFTERIISIRNLAQCKIKIHPSLMQLVNWAEDPLQCRQENSQTSASDAATIEIYFTSSETGGASVQCIEHIRHLFRRWSMLARALVASPLRAIFVPKRRHPFLFARSYESSRFRRT